MTTEARQAAIARFSSALVPQGDCLIYAGTADWAKGGYARVWFAGRRIMAHRLSWELANGAPVPSHLVVCHACDNPPCVRPEHLWLGSKGENNLDRDRKGRQVALPGSRNGNHKIFEDDVRVIRASRAAGVSAATLAVRFGVSTVTVQRIVARKGWRHVA